MTPSKADQVRRQPSRFEASPIPSLNQQAITVDELSTIFEHFWSQLFPTQGLLLLDCFGKPVLSTPKARKICKDIQNNSSAESNHPSQDDDDLTLPQIIQTMADLMIDSRKEFPGQKIQLQEELFEIEAGLHIDLKAEWTELDDTAPKFILVALEDMAEVAHQRSLCDAFRYSFTPRETEVWSLYLQGFSYRQIGQRLYIALSTVKKHLKSVQSKRRGECF